MLVVMKGINNFDLSQKKVTWLVEKQHCFATIYIYVAPWAPLLQVNHFPLPFNSKSTKGTHTNYPSLLTLLLVAFKPTSLFQCSHPSLRKNISILFMSKVLSQISTFLQVSWYKTNWIKNSKINTLTSSLLSTLLFSGYEVVFYKVIRGWW